METKTRCLIIDDEPLAIKLIRTHLSKLDSFEIAGECKNPLKAIEFLKKEKIETRHFRHIDIEEHQIYLLLLKEFNSFKRILTFTHYFK